MFFSFSYPITDVDTLVDNLSTSKSKELSFLPPEQMVEQINIIYCLNFNDRFPPDFDDKELWAEWERWLKIICEEPASEARQSFKTD